MEAMIKLCVCAAILALICGSVQNVHVNVRSPTATDVQQKAVENLIKRILPREFQKFSVAIDPTLGPEFRNTFHLSSLGDSVHIVGKDGVSAAWGFHHYLKEFCNCHISWEGRQLNVPTRLPRLPPGGIRVTSNDQFRYYANVCTFSYSFVWWTWERWERHLDWMALNAINLPLAFTGQEAIWRSVYLQLGLRSEELDEHFTGPAFLAWGRMGNIRGWGGPLPYTWYTQQLELQKRIVARMREFGMIPVLPGFAGHVPEALTRLFPDANVTRLGTWSHFNRTYSATLLLDARYPLFAKIGNAYIAEMRKQFGVDHVYNADPFNEMVPRSSDPRYLTEFGQGVFAAMTGADEKAVWLLQGWMFHFSPSYWQSRQVKALVTSVPIGKMLILDLYSDQKPMYEKFHSYYGQPFIWCMLLNFGGALGYYGRIETVNSQPSIARTMANSSMIGLGLTMEGIFQNYVMYEFLLDKSNNDAVDIGDWMSAYSRRRYGRSVRKLELYWQKASESVLNCTEPFDDHGQFILMKRPNLKTKPFIWYEPRSVLFMWRKMLQGAEVASGPLLQYDLVDVTRQGLDVASTHIFHQVIQAYKRRDLPKLVKSAETLLRLLLDLDEILKSDPNFLLGNWIRDARNLGTNSDEENLYEFNARNQITLWGPSGEISDYAKKQWSGLVDDYYKPRWELFLSRLMEAVRNGRKFNHDEFKKDVLERIERPFSYARKRYPTSPLGDPLSISTRLFEVYKSFLSSHKIPRFTYRSRKHPRRAGWQ